MSQYRFYYDESEHSRKIGLKTITAENYYDNFVSVIIGWSEEKKAEIEQAYLAFEEKYNDRKHEGELKSSTIKNRQLRYGFASLDENNTAFLSDLLTLFSDNVFVYYSSHSKIEYIMNQLFCDYSSNFIVDKNALIYTIVKALVINKPQEVQNAIYKSPDAFIKALKGFLQRKIAIDKGNIELKEMEIKAFEQALIIIDTVQAPNTIDWDYTPPFMGFKDYLKVREIKNYTLTIDREGDEQKTVNAAIAAGIANATDSISSETIGIRMADMLAGVISKMMKALAQSLHSSSIRKTLLSNKWFRMNSDQFALYKKLYHIIVENKEYSFKAFASIYADDILALLSLLDYMNHFKKATELEEKIEFQGLEFPFYLLQDYRWLKKVLYA